MSDPAKCEACGKIGRRPRMHLAPEGWLYIETKIDDAEDDGVITWACSQTCAAALWKVGPGPRQTDDGDRQTPSVCTDQEKKR